jgi:hypothetical protein
MVYPAEDIGYGKGWRLNLSQRIIPQVIAGTQCRAASQYEPERDGVLLYSQRPRGYCRDPHHRRSGRFENYRSPAHRGGDPVPQPGPANLKLFRRRYGVFLQIVLYYSLEKTILSPDNIFHASIAL